MKSKLLLIVFFIMAFSSLYSQSVHIGEELVYNVSYSGINLGQVTLTTEQEETLNGTPVYKMKCTMKSNPGIPFVGLNVIFESWMDKSLSFSHKFIGNTETNEGWVYQELLFDYSKKQIIEKKFKNKQLFFTKTTNYKNKCNDGMSLFFLARKYSGKSKSYQIPTYVEDTTLTNINFTNKIESVSIDAVPYSVKVNYLYGKIGFKGVYGLSGNYEGWFSADEAAIPIKAKMNVIVGSVVLELVSWKRNNWQPPKSDSSKS